MTSTLVLLAVVSSVIYIVMQCDSVTMENGNVSMYVSLFT